MIESAFRLDYDACRDLLAARLSEPGASRIQLLAGPRQVGKTTLLLDLAARHGSAAVYAAADSPAAALPGFWERTWNEAAEAARIHGRAVVLLDEVHLVPGWASRLKGEWDRVRRHRQPIHVVATGSSSLRLAAGSRESLAGRFERLTLAHWSARSLASAFALSREDAVRELVGWGSYPGAFELRRDVGRRTAYVRDAILEPAIGRDLLALGPVRKPGLLRQVFGVAVHSPAQIVSLAKIQGQLQDPGALETISHYLGLLEDAFLVATLPKFTVRPVRQRASPPKLVTLNNALLTVLHPEGAPDPATAPARFGAWVENACLAHAWNAGQTVRYWREEPLEVDAIVDGSWGAWAIEVKTGDIDPARLRGLAEFTRRFPQYRPLVLCDERGHAAVSRLGLRPRLWSDFLFDGPPRSE
ncbi:MAG: ATP-binding protein [Vicinamibacterales bacterium]|nr:ATP-binding protein [Vicinamibacterales bacterium]